MSFGIAALLPRENWRLADKKMTIFTKKLSDFNKEFNLL